MEIYLPTDSRLEYRKRSKPRCHVMSKYFYYDTNNNSKSLHEDNFFTQRLGLYRAD